MLQYRQDKLDKTKTAKKENLSPVLIVYAPINRYHIMDLTPEKSVIRDLLSKDLDVYLIDWVNPSWDDDKLRIEDYINYIHDAIKLIKDESNTETVSILGYYWGRILSLIYSSLYTETAKKLAVIASPIHISKDNSILSRGIKSIDSDKMIREFRHMDSQILDMGFVLRNPSKYAFDKYLKFYQKISDKKFMDTFIAVEKWLYNTPSIPTKLYSQIINDCYKNSLLIQNRMRIYNKVINLASLDIPILIITAKNDDLISPETTLALREYLPNTSKIDSLQIPGGHVELCISTKACERLWPETPN